MQHLPSIAALRAFREAAASLSFTRAAAQLNVTQGAVSHQVKGLEEQLGVALFHRVRQRLTLTEAGREFLPFVRQALDLLQAGTNQISNSRDSGVLTVSVSPNFASKWLVHRLGDFIAAHPEIELRISASMAHIDLAQSDVDMAVRHGNGDWPDLDVTPLTPEVIFPVCSPDFLARSGPFKTPADLAAQTLLHDRSRRDWPDWFKTAGLQVEDNLPGLQFDQTSMVLDAALEGQGIALARSALAARDLIAGRLVRLSETEMPAPFGYYILSAKPVAKTEKITAFRRWLLDEAERDRKGLAQSLNEGGIS